MAKLRITWKKSTIGRREDQKRTVKALGLRRLGHTIEIGDSPSVRGMINRVHHLVTVEEAEN